MRLLTLIAAAFTIAAAPAPVPAIAQTRPATDWNRTVTTTPGGSFVLGNPAAKTRLVEYFSYTCSHCAAFMVDGMGPLRTGWVRRGLVAIEFRNAVRDPYDLTAALLARCGGKARFVSNHEALFNNYQAWTGQVEAYVAAREPGQQMPDDQGAALGEIADKTGLTAFMAKRGLAPAAQKLCLTDKAATAAVLAMTKDAWETRKIGGTPAFLLNGKLVEAHGWEALKPLLPALPAGGK